MVTLLNGQVLPSIRITPMRQRLLLGFASLKAGKKKNFRVPHLSFLLIGNFVSILSAYPLCFFHPLVSYFFLCQFLLFFYFVLGVGMFVWTAYQTIWIPSSPSKARHISFEEWQARGGRDQSHAKLKFKRKLKKHVVSPFPSCSTKRKQALYNSRERRDIIKQPF